MDNLTGEQYMQLVLADCCKQLVPDYSITANTFKVNWSTLSRHYRRIQSSRTESRVEHCQRLKPEEEEQLIDFINKLTDRSILPTS